MYFGKHALKKEDLEPLRKGLQIEGGKVDLDLKTIYEEHVLGRVSKAELLPNGSLKVVLDHMERKNPHGIVYANNPWLRFRLIFQGPHLVKKTENDLEITSHGEHIKISVVAPKATQ